MGQVTDVQVGEYDGDPYVQINVEHEGEQHRHALRFKRNDDPKRVALVLRRLADWVEKYGV